MRTDTVAFALIAAAAMICSVWTLSREAATPLPPSVAPIASPDPAVIRKISPAEALPRIQDDQKIVLLDVRTPEEYTERHIPGSVLLPVGPAETFGPQVEKLVPDKQATVFIYCRSGRRSHAAAEIMAALGYQNVYDLGGINDWPYETESGSPAK